MSAQEGTLSSWNGAKLREMRKALKMTQAELGLALGMTRDFVGWMELGRAAIQLRTELAVRYLTLAQVPAPSPVTDETALSGEVRFMRRRLSDIKELALAASHLTGVPDFDIIANYATEALTAKAILNVDDHLTALASTPQPAVAEDTQLLDALRDESWDLRSFAIPTGGDDADIGWRVISHWMTKPQERVVGEVYTDDPRAAIRDAIRQGQK